MSLATSFTPEDDALVDTMRASGIRYKNTAKWLSRLVFAMSELEAACNPTEQIEAEQRVGFIIQKLGGA